jgi:hypothetical protein
MASERFTKLPIIIRRLKIAIYSLVNEYRRLIHMATSTNKDFTKMCRVTNGTVDEEGNIFVTKSMLSNFATNFKTLCLEKAIYWAQFYPAIDIFINNLINFEDPIVLIKFAHNKQLKFLYECWFGEIYISKYEDSFVELTNEVLSKKKNINLELFQELNTITEPSSENEN